ncbi:MAG: response regulator transcription factor [Alphaproteobacteria bacterium]|nr:response regulator transcription factor [Alphaproteobacteria bacterium]
MMGARILCVDDDENLQEVLKQYLEDNGANVMQALNGRDALEKAKTIHLDVILLDLALPDSAGVDLIKGMHDCTDAALIVVSGKSDTTEKIICLEMGADDYITKPFELRELAARIKAVRRRREVGESSKESTSTQKAERVKFMGWCLDRTQYQLFDENNQSAGLTTGEFKLLEALVLAPRRTYSREQLFELTRDANFDGFDRAIDIQIARLRKKLGNPDLIKTIRGVGYMFCGDTKAA